VTLRPPKGYVILMACLLGPTGAVFAGAGILAIAQRQPLPGAVLCLFGLVLWGFLVGTGRMELKVDATGVARSAPWRERISRDDLGSIQFVAVRPPVWAFVRKDGRRAFTVSAYLFSQEDLTTMASLLGTRVEAPPNLAL